MKEHVRNNRQRVYDRMLDDERFSQKGTSKTPIVVACIIVVLLLVSIVIAIWRCTFVIREAHEQELIDNLYSTASQKATTIQTALNAEQTLLGGVATEVSDNLREGWTYEQLQQMFDSIDASYGFKRLGYIDSNLVAYGSDRTMRSVAMDAELADTLEGKNTITSPRMDTFDNSGDLITIFRVPVYATGNEHAADEQPIGAVFGSVLSSNLDSMFNVEGYENAGVLAILTEDGSVVDATSDTVFDSVGFSFPDYMDATGADASAAQELRSGLASGTSGSSHFYADDGAGTSGGYYLYHIPLDLENSSTKWQLAIVVPDSYLESMVDDLMSNVYRMIVLVVLCLLVAVVVSIVAIRHMRKSNRNRLRKFAYQDALTGGDNFNRFKELLEEEDTSGVLVSIDIRSFKDINSVCGVARGDQILVLVWQNITKVLAEGDRAARVGSDHFVIFFKRPDDLSPEEQGAIQELAELDKAHDGKFHDVLSEITKENVRARLMPLVVAMAKMSHDLETPVLVPSFGVYRWVPGSNVEECYSRAVSAGQHSADSPDGYVAFFSEEDFRRINEDSATIKAFEPALKNGEFEPFYQPKYHTDGTLAGAEALARWRKPDGTLVPPFKFIPLYEHNGMIRPLDQAIFTAVCQQQAQWMAEGKRVVPVSINLSRASLHYQGVHDEYVRIVREAGISPSLVPIEITESAIADDAEVAKAIRDFRTSGFAIHMDDFGSGYSSLAALGSMNFDALKIDKSLVDCIGGESGENLLKHSVKLAQEMNLTVTAEGVEREEQVAFLKALGCDNIQGFYFSKPLPVGEFDALL